MTPARIVSLCTALAACPAAALSLALDMPPAARQTGERVSPFDSYELPLGPHAGGAVPVERVEGRVSRVTWRIDGASATTLQVLAPLREQLREAGFDILFECDSAGCGGFDFRFGIEVVPAPDMHVDIQDFRFLAARRGEAAFATLLVSRSRAALFIQSVMVAPADSPAAGTGPAPAAAAPADTGPSAIPEEPATPLADRLMTHGHAVLSDLAFAPGGSSLEERPYPSLKALADFIDANPDLVIVLVGHTDTVGDLASNIVLSKRRAEAVRTRLIGSHDVAPARVEAEGNGYLSPIATNLTPEGREANRRVEAIVRPR